MKMGHASRSNAEETNHGDKNLGTFLGETGTNFSIDLQLRMTEMTKEPSLLKTLDYFERQQQDNMPKEYMLRLKKLSTSNGFVFYEDRKILRKNVGSLLHDRHSAVKKMSKAVSHFWWPKITQASQMKCDGCILCEMSDKKLKPNLNSGKKNQASAFS